MVVLFTGASIRYECLKIITPQYTLIIYLPHLNFGSVSVTSSDARNPLRYVHTDF